MGKIKVLELCEILATLYRLARLIADNLLLTLK